MKTRALCVLAIVLVVVACTWSPDADEIYYVDVPAGKPTGSISLQTYDSEDTIFIYQPTGFSYSTSGESRNVPKKTDVYLGSKKIASGDSQGSFSISSDNLVTGTYELKIVFTTNSNSGSLADVFDLETAEIWKKWIVVVDIDAPPRPTLKATIENGFLKLSWTPFTKKSFTMYAIAIETGGGVYDKEIFNSKENYFIANEYVGGVNAKLTVTTFTATQSATSDIVELNDDANFSIDFNPADSVTKLTWSKCRYPGAFDKYIVQVNHQDVHLSRVVSDTTYSFKPNVVFGKQLEMTLRWQGNSSTVDISKRLDIQIGGIDNLPRNQAWHYSEKLKSIVSFDSWSNFFFIYDDQLRKTDSVRIAPGYSLPYPGDKLYFPVYGGVTVYELVAHVSRFLPVTTLGAIKETPDEISAGGHILTYDWIDRSSGFDAQYNRRVYDLDTDQVLSYTQTEWTPGGYYFLLQLADNGTKAFNPNPVSISSFNGTEYVYDFDLLNSPGYFRMFRPENPNEIILSGFNGSAAALVVTKTTSRNISTPEPAVLKGYDIFTKRLAFFSAPDKYYLVDVDNGATRKITAVEGCTFVGGYLFSPAGFAIKLM